MTEERRLAAIMFSDICGYSRIMGEDETRALTILDMSDSCVEQAADIYGGRVIKKMGDGTLAEFSSAVNAVQAALEVQRAVAEHNADAIPAEQFQLRIGIHVGDVVVSNGDILGDGVNVASRIEPLAEPGGICISRDVFDLVHNKISIETVRLGPRELKNISRQIDIYKVFIDAVQAKGTPISRTPSAPSKRRSVLAFVIGALLTVLLVLGGIALKNYMFNRRAENEFIALRAEVERMIHEEQPREALERLQSYPEIFSATPWQEQINEMIPKVQDLILRQDIKDRQLKFLRSVENNDRETAMSMIDPKVLEHIDTNGLWLRLRFMAGLLKIANIDTQNLRIGEVQLLQDKKVASVHMQIRRITRDNPDGNWESIPPSEWHLVEGEWLLHIEPPKKPVQKRSPLPGRRAGRR